MIKTNNIEPHKNNFQRTGGGKKEQERKVVDIRRFVTRKYCSFHQYLKIENTLELGKQNCVKKKNQA